jgi:hypothetical protein
VGCGAGMRILPGAGAVAGMGPAVLSSHNKGTLLCQYAIHMSQQNAYVTEKDTCHSTTHVSLYTCDGSIHMSQHTTHVTKQAVHATQDTDYAICSKRPCIARKQHKFAACMAVVLQHCCKVQTCIWQICICACLKRPCKPSCS